MIINKFENQEKWIDAVLDALDLNMGDVVGLAGGGTPKPIYESLDFETIRFVSIDERKDGSNLKMITEAMPNALVTGFDASLPIGDALNEMRTFLEGEIAQKGYIFDLLILGMGPDGHIASIFPDSEIGEGLVAHTTTEVFDVYDRMTLTFEALKSAKRTILLIKGEEKLSLLDNLKGDLPIDQLVEGLEVFAY